MIMNEIRPLSAASEILAEAKRYLAAGGNLFVSKAAPNE